MGHSLTAGEENRVCHPAQVRHSETTHLLKHYAEYKPFMDDLRHHVAAHRGFYRAALRANTHPDGYLLPAGFDGPFQRVRDARYGTDYRRQFRADLAAIVQRWGLTQPPDGRRADDVDFADRIADWCLHHAWRDGEYGPEELWKPRGVWIDSMLPRPTGPASRISITIALDWQADRDPWDVTPAGPKRAGRQPWECTILDQLETEFRRQATAERERIEAEYRAGGWTTGRGATEIERDTRWLSRRLRGHTPEQIKNDDPDAAIVVPKTISNVTVAVAGRLDLTIPRRQRRRIA